ncbi:MAG: hypothetical protein PHF86_05515 [Candidatus Nanoarchaeia archaeon]|nr:hypothetical protein [Candidatus Nanoarchaeia archaeon]
MSKRGQITIYFVVIFVLAVIVTSLFYLREYYINQAGQTQVSEVATVPKELDTIKQEVRDCTQTFVEDSIYYVASRSGILEGNSVFFEYTNVSYLVVNKKNLLPSTVQMETIISNYINTNLASVCATTDIESQKVNSIIRIKDQEVSVVVNWPIVISKSGISGTIDQFSFVYKMRLGEFRNVVSQIIENQIKYYPDLCLSCMAKIAVSNDGLIQRYIQDKDQIFVIQDNSNEKLKFGYAVRY